MTNKKGFTLIELVLVVALMGIVLSIIFSPIVFSFKNFDMQNKKTNIISDTRATMDYLTREIRKADEVIVKNGSLAQGGDGGITIDSEEYSLENGVLSKEGMKIVEGINDIFIESEENGKLFTIKVTIEDYELSSDINLRE